MASLRAPASAACAVRTRYARRPSSTAAFLTAQRMGPQLAATSLLGCAAVLRLNAAAGVQPLEEHQVLDLMGFEAVGLEGVAPLVEGELVQLGLGQRLVLSFRWGADGGVG